MLYNRFIDCHYKAGAVEVHLIFEKPLTGQFSPKVFERQRKYDCRSGSTNVHVHITFNPNMPVPSQWREHLECRACKRALVEAIGATYMEHALHRLSGIVSHLAGFLREDRALVIRQGSMQPDERYTSNAEEADMKL